MWAPKALLSRPQASFQGLMVSLPQPQVLHRDLQQLPVQGPADGSGGVHVLGVWLPG